MSRSPAGSGIGRTLAAGLLAVALVVAGAGEGQSQHLSPKRALPSAGSQGCPPIRQTTVATREVQEQVRLLVARAQQAVLADELSTAAQLLSEAAQRDPANADVAYQRARLLEETGDAAGAAGEFCRFLALAPGSPDVPDVRDRLAVLAAASPDRGFSPEVVVQFGNGIVYLERDDFGGAIRAFSYVLQHQPDLAEAHFNRGLAYLGARRRAQASRDFESYLSLNPEAPDRGVVLQQMQLAAQTPSRSAEGVLIRGMLIPGLGQFVTHRPLQGALVTLATGSAIALGLQTREAERTVTFLDPFNNPREYVRLETERPYLGAGIAAALAVSALGALEAYLHVRQSDGGGRTAAAEPPRGPRPVIRSEGQAGVGLGLSLPVGNR